MKEDLGASGCFGAGGVSSLGGGAEQSWVYALLGPTFCDMASFLPGPK